MGTLHSHDNVQLSNLSQYNVTYVYNDIKHLDTVVSEIQSESDDDNDEDRDDSSARGITITTSTWEHLQTLWIFCEQKGI